jgi:hypothetical protein
MNFSILFSDEKIKTFDEALSFINDCQVWKFFDDRAISFVNKFSSMLLKYPTVNKFPDLVALAYWFRRSNVKKLKQTYFADQNIARIGRGLSLHIAPSNVDTIFVYSFFLSLLAGNSSFIRVSQSVSPQLAIIIKILEDIYDAGDTEAVRRFIICTYPHESDATRRISECCELRIVWGGDETVKTITSIPLKPTALELKFPNRSSFSIISLSALKKTNDNDLQKLCYNLYSDIKLFGQQACSSPLAIFFIGSSSKSRQLDRFWGFFEGAINNNELSSSEVMNRFVGTSSMAISGTINKPYVSMVSKNFLVYDGNLTSQSSFRKDHPGNGTLIQYFLSNIEDIGELVRAKDQTVSVFGFTLEEIRNLLTSLKNRGIDRVVPIGQALEFSNIWDGIDLLDTMSRKIEISKLIGNKYVK